MPDMLAGGGVDPDRDHGARARGQNQLGVRADAGQHLANNVICRQWQK